MRAVAFTSFGSPEVLSVVDLPVTEPSEGQVRIQVQAAPVQPADLAARSGAFGPMLPEGPHYVPGWDLAGIVDAVGPGVQTLTPGDPVVGMSDWLTTKVGTQAEFVILNASALAPAPAGRSPVEAATLPVNAHTAAQALDLLGLVEGQILAITGAGGAVGGYAVELARHRGISVIGLGSRRDEQFVLERGATFVARGGDPAAQLRAVSPRGVDGLLDTALLGNRTIAAVRDGGGFVSLMPPVTPPSERGIRVATTHVHSDGEQLRQLVRLAEKGHLTLRVGGTFAFEDAATAHAQFAKGGTRGRLVLTSAIQP